MATYLTLIGERDAIDALAETAAPDSPIFRVEDREAFSETEGLGLDFQDLHSIVVWIHEHADLIKVAAQMLNALLPLARRTPQPIQIILRPDNGEDVTISVTDEQAVDHEEAVARLAKNMRSALHSRK